jgi:putative oxidoreductase
MSSTRSVPAATPRPSWHDALRHLPASLLLRASVLASRVAGRPLRVSLGLVFLWFGALKVAGHSDAYGLIAATVPVNPRLFVPALGAVELTLGLGMLAGWARRLMPVAMIAHLSGTFLTFAAAPGRMFRGADPLLLTMTGEFVVKNLVLIGAAAVLLGSVTTSPGRIRRHDPAQKS